LVEKNGTAGPGDVDVGLVDADEPLFVDDLSDFEMDDILQGTQTEGETSTGAATIDETRKDESPKTAGRDEFEDEMDAMNDMGDFF
jgi:hypothetical protein